jgi:hypothetical protein
MLSARSFGLVSYSLTIASSALPTLAIISYFSGWQYVNEYFSSFNINRSSFSFNDYTVFTYSFSVAVNLPKIIVVYKLSALKWIGPLLLLFIGPYIVKGLSSKIIRLSLLRIWSWLWLLVALFFSSQQAGAIDAKKVMEGNARAVDIIFSKTFKENLIISKGEPWADQKISEIQKAAKNNALVLIWRSSNDTILLIFGSSGDNHGKPIEILRINSKEIVSTITKI